MKNRKFLIALLLIATLLFTFAACRTAPQNDENATSSAQHTTSQPVTTEKIRVAAIKGPTGMGMIDLMDDEKYSFVLTSDPTEIVSLISSKGVDIAACPLNLAANLYKKTNGGIKMIGLNTLGVLYIVSNGADLQNIKDLKGETVYSTGQGTTVEYILNYILTENGLKVGEDVKVEYLSEHSELVAKMATGNVKFGVLPQPFVTAATTKNDKLKVTLSLTDEWNKISPETQLSMGCLIARTDFIENNKAALKAFIDENKLSVKAVNDNPASAAEKIAEKGIIESKAVAEKAIPHCNIVFIDSQEMKTIAKANFEVYFNADPKSIGGAIPDDAIYYEAEK